MNTKIVYTVVGGEKDYYLPQAMVAVYTARKNNPEAEILLVVDQDTNDVIEKELNNIRNYLNKVIVVTTPSNMPKMHRSRFLKTSLRQNIEGDFLYIDTDTVVCEDLSEIDSVDADIAAVLDRHYLISEHPLIGGIEQNISSVGLTIDDLRDKYFNGGVMLVRDTPISHRLFKSWHHNWDKSRQNSRGIDQPPLALANKQCGYPIKELDGVWNCQLCDNFINYLFEAKVLHYFASNGRSPYLLSRNETFNELMCLGDIPDWLKVKLEAPKCYFTDKHILAFDEDVHFLRTNIHTMYIYHRWLFNILEFISKTLIKISKINK